MGKITHSNKMQPNAIVWFDLFARVKDGKQWQTLKNATQWIFVPFPIEATFSIY